MEQECQSNKCCCPCHSQQEESCHSEDKHAEFSNYFLEIADMAWEEVLKDKIKEHIVSTQNARMKELAKIVSEGNNQRWKHKMEKKRGCMEFQEKLGHFFSHSKK